MKSQAKSIILNRKSFIKEMRQESFVRYTLSKIGKQITLAATDPNGTELMFGTAAGNIRYWTDLNNPTKFLEDSGITEFSVVIEGESA